MTSPTWPIGPVPGQWGDPPGYVVDADDMHERIDERLDDLWTRGKRAAGTGCTLTSDPTVITSGGSPQQVDLIPTPRGLGEAWTVVGGGVKVPKIGLYLVSVFLQPTTAVSFTSRALIDVLGGNEGRARHPVELGTIDAAVAVTVPKTVTAVGSNDVITVAFFHNSGSSRTVKVTGSIVRMVDL